MTLLIIAAIWISALALIASLCAAASRGDSQPQAAVSEAQPDRLYAAAQARPAVSPAQPSRRTGAGERGELAPATRAAA